MNPDLTSRLLDAERSLERSTADAGEDVTAHLRTQVARRRRSRHLREVAGGVAVAVVIGTASWAVAGPDGTPPPVATTPSPTTTIEPSPSLPPSPPQTAAPSPSATPTTPVVPPTAREQEIDDATVLERLAQPRTGEVWTTPVRAPEMDAVLSSDLAPLHAWLVGHRGDSEIYVLVDGQSVTDEYGLYLRGVRVVGLYEVDADGPREITCPSARAGDPCREKTWVTTDAPQDEATFYDSLTLPREVDLGGGWLLTTRVTTGASWFAQALLGDARSLYGVGAAVETVADLGALDVVQLVEDGDVEGLDDRSYAIRLPYGATVTLSADDAPSGEFGSIRWDDGRQRPLAFGGDYTESASPGASTCTGGTFSVEVRHVATEWRAAGTTPGGHRVFVPVEGGNAVSRAVREFHEEGSFGYNDDYEDVQGIEAGYRYASDEAFLADHALYAIRGPAGEWQLRLRSDALSVVYECV